jgi:hypothetical protein
MTVIFAQILLHVVKIILLKDGAKLLLNVYQVVLLDQSVQKIGLFII